MPELYSYTAFGLAIRSEIRLPLMERAPSFGSVNLEIIKRAIPDSLKQQAGDNFYTVLENGGILCHVPSVAHYLIRPDASIVVDARREATPEAIELFLLGSAMGAVLHHQEGIVIHGSAVTFDELVIVFSGPSGAGKSTLAAAFAQEGHKILTDDVAVIRFNEERAPVVWPGYPQMKLWKASLEMFQTAEDGLKPIYNRIDKFNVPIQDVFSSSPAPLNALFILETQPKPVHSQPAITQLSGIEAYKALLNNTYRIEYLSEIGNAERHFHACSRLSNQIPVYKLTRPDRGCDPKQMVRTCRAVISSPFERKKLQRLL